MIKVKTLLVISLLLIVKCSTTVPTIDKLVNIEYKDIITLEDKSLIYPLFDLAFLKIDVTATPAEITWIFEAYDLARFIVNTSEFKEAFMKKTFVVGGDGVNWKQRVSKDGKRSIKRNKPFSNKEKLFRIFTEKAIYFSPLKQNQKNIVCGRIFPYLEDINSFEFQNMMKTDTAFSTSSLANNIPEPWQGGYNEKLRAAGDILYTTGQMIGFWPVPYNNLAAYGIRNLIIAVGADPKFQEKYKYKLLTLSPFSELLNKELFQ